MTTNISPVTTDLSDNAIAYLTDIVEEYMTSGEPFTSLDIANAAKDAGHFARNQWVAAWLRSNAIEISHQLTAMYNQTLIEVNSSAVGMTYAYLYHHMDFDPDDYAARSQVPLQTVGHRSQPVKVPVGRAAAAAAAIIQGTQTVGQQHQSVVDRQTGGVTTTHNQSTPQRRAVQRDAYGRFTNNPGAPVTPPTHFKSQRRDGKGRFTKS